MRCIFCKTLSDKTRAVEHIIPESMGNRDHVLPRGAVCCKCNGYFGRKIERPVLEAGLFRHIRSRMAVPNKRGRIPILQDPGPVEKPGYRLMGRFLAKVGLEVLAFKARDVASWNDEIVDNRGLDDIRGFARYNVGDDWPFTTRTLYPVDAVFSDGDETYELFHEFDILCTENQELYLVLSLFGVELTLNLGGREMDGYKAWLEENAFASPLYAGKNASQRLDMGASSARSTRQGQRDIAQ